MNLKDIFEEAKRDWREQELVLVDEYDENGNLITIIKHDVERIAVFLHDIEGMRALHHIMTYKEFDILDYGNFKRLRDELFYYAK